MIKNNPIHKAAYKKIKFINQIRGRRSRKINRCESCVGICITDWSYVRRIL